MKEPYLEVTFRHGRPIAAYLYLPRMAGEKSHRTKRLEPGLIIDFDRDGKPIGIEITAPGQITLASLNQVLRDLGLSEISSADLAPLCAA
jgi:uncharacterized protein YuzE